MIPLFDCHCDTALKVFDSGASLRENAFHLDLTRLSEFSPCVQVFAVCTELRHGAAQKAETVLNELKCRIDKNSDIVKLCLNLHDIAASEREGKISAIISIEGAEQIPDLEKAYHSGVRIVHPTWNYDNALCGAAMGGGSGLSDKGKAFIKEAQSLGILLDMSHISEKGFFEVLELAEKPVIAGHSNAYALCPHKRNLSDEQFTALIANGGGAGINLNCDFLGEPYDFTAAVRHIEHFLSLGGEKSVFLGCDFDGVDRLSESISGVEAMPQLYEMLLKLNYGEELVRDIFYGNIRTIIGRVL